MMNAHVTPVSDGTLAMVVTLGSAVLCVTGMVSLTAITAIRWIFNTKEVDNL